MVAVHERRMASVMRRDNGCDLRRLKSGFHRRAHTVLALACVEILNQDTRWEPPRDPRIDRQ
jgi:hypothetical protein